MICLSIGIDDDQKDDNYQQGSSRYYYHQTRDLKEVLVEDELNIFYILFKDVQFQVRCGEEYGKKITTNIGTPQGDCASALFSLFTQPSPYKIKEQNTKKNTTMPDQMKRKMKLHQYTYKITATIKFSLKVPSTSTNNMQMKQDI